MGSDGGQDVLSQRRRHGQGYLRRDQQLHRFVLTERLAQQNIPGAYS
jgi:hypothetical protein